MFGMRALEDGSFRALVSQGGRLVDLHDSNYVHEGISYVGLSGQTDGGRPGPQGGATHDPKSTNNLPGGPDNDSVEEADVVPFSGTGGPSGGDGTYFVYTDSQAPWDKSRGSRPKVRPRMRPKVKEIRENWLMSQPTDATSTGKIRIRVLDHLYLQVHAPQRILEQVEAFHFFEQFTILLPNTPMLSIRTMWSIAEWWKSMAVKDDLLEIDCVNGFATVTNESSNNFYALGTFGGASQDFHNAV